MIDVLATETHTAIIREVGPREEAAWDSFVSCAPNGHILQSWAWGEFKRSYGWQPVRLALSIDGEIRAGAQVLIRSIAGVSLPYVPRGPVVAPDRPELYFPLLDAIHRLGKGRHGVFLKVEPNELAGSTVEPLLRSRGFLRSAHTVQARATLHVPLDGGEEVILAQMKGKTRYNVRLAERRGVQIRAASSADDLARFHQLMVETGERDEFPVRSLAYYRDVLEAFRSRGQGELLLAEFDGLIVAGIMVFAYGPEGIYMYGASSNKHRREMPTYLLQWRAIQWCLEHGCSRYDMWGIPEQVADGTDERDALEAKNVRTGLWGVYRFKQGFGGEHSRYTGAYDYPYNRPLYLLWARLRKSKEL